MKWARRVDATHGEVVRELRRLGLLVLDVSRLPALGCDLVVFAPTTDRARLVEVKDGRVAPSSRRLTRSESALATQAGTVYRVVGGVEDAIALAQELLRCR